MKPTTAAVSSARRRPSGEDQPKASSGLVSGLRVMQLSAASPERPKSRASAPQPHPQPHSAPLLTLGAIESVRSAASGNLSAAVGPQSAMGPAPPATAPADLVNYTNSDDMLLCGALHKRGAFFKTWLPRYVVLSRAALRVYRKNPLDASVSAKDARKLLKDEVLRADALRVEAADGFRHRAFCFALVVRKRPRRFGIPSSSPSGHHGDLRRKESNLDSSGNLPSGPLSHHSSSNKPKDTGRVLVIYLQATREAERVRWLKALQRWIDGGDPLGIVPLPSPSGSASSASTLVSVSSSIRSRALLQYIVSNAYQSYRYGRKMQTSGGRASASSSSLNQLEFSTSEAATPSSPTAQRLGRAIEREFPVLASLVRELDACEDEGELVYILDQVLGEAQDAFSASSTARHAHQTTSDNKPVNATTVRAVKALVAAAGEAKLDACPQCWTDAVRAAYASIMRSLHFALKAADAPSSSRASAAVPSSTTTCPASPRSVAPPRPPCDSDSDSEGDASDGSRRNDDEASALCRDATRDDDAPAAASDAPKKPFHRTYKLGRKLGAGGFSVVHIAAHRRTRKQVAVKIISKRELLLAGDSAALAALQHEVRIMATLDHPNLVPLLDFFDERDFCYLVTPLCTGGELFDALVRRKSYTERDARALLRKLARAIAYLHARGIVHRDLKPENILLKSSAPDAEIMIADFGFARDLRTLSGRRGTACGTPGYVAPEVVRGEPYGAEVDCWSLGVILFILLCGYPPFGGKNHAVVLDKVAHGAFAFEAPYWDAVSPAAKDLVQKLLTVDRRQRLRAEDIERHPWMAMGEDEEDGEVGGEEEEQQEVQVAAADESERKAAADEDGERPRRGSDLLPALRQMRAHNHTLTHGSPRIQPSDLVDVDSDDEQEVEEVEAADAREAMDRDRELLERELMGLGMGDRDSLGGASDDE